MNDNKHIPWYQSSWAQAITWIFGLIGVVAVLLPLLSEPRSSLSAGYQKVPFVIPDKLQKKGLLDTLIAKRDTSIARRDSLIGVLHAIIRQLKPKENLPVLPPLLGLPLGGYYGLGETPTAAFALRYSTLCVLRVTNEGDKELKELQVLHEASTNAYYEYKDSNGRLQKGNSFGKFLLGDLAPTEAREVYLWVSSGLGTSGITITHPEGKLQAEETVEVTGIFGWLFKNRFYLYFPLSLVVSLLVPYFIFKFQQRRQAAIAKSST